MDAHDIFKDIDEATDLAEALFEGDRQRALTWMVTPQKALSDEIPRLVIVKGDGHIVLEWLKSRLGKP